MILAFSSIAQQSVDVANRLKAEEIIKSAFGNDGIKSDYLLYNIRDKYIVIVKDSLNYVTCYISEKNGVENKTVNGLEVDFYMNKLFDLCRYEERYVLSGTKYESDCPATYIYLVLFKQGVRVVEINLPSMLLCSEKKVIYPIENNLNELLFNMINRYWYN